MTPLNINIKQCRVMEKYTKKATARILKEVLKINPKASGLTTLDQAFVQLMGYWDLEISLETNSKGVTKATLHKDGERPYEWVWDDVFSSKSADWDWNVIYKTILEDIIKQKLYKRPKLGKRALAKLAKENQNKIEDTPQEEDLQIIVDEYVPDIDSLKKQRDRLSAKLSMWKKSGKDITNLAQELSKIREQIKNSQKHSKFQR